MNRNSHGVRVALTGLIAFFLSAAVISADSTVEIYADFRPDLFGVAPDRSEILSFSLEEIARNNEVQGPNEGILTAVTVASGVRDQLFALLQEEGRTRMEEYELLRLKREGRDVFTLRSPENGLSLSFSLEKCGAEIYDVIDRVYPVRSDTALEVKTHYGDHFVVRIHGAENFINPSEDILDFGEALVAASLIGEAFQPLMGIRDGRDLLGNLGYIVVERANRHIAGELYRPVTAHEDAIQQFLLRLRNMTGNPVENLYIMTAASFRLEETNGRIELPEDVVGSMRGDTFDLAFFFYDILRRLGFEARLLCIKEGGDVADLTAAVVFREGREWKFLDEMGVDDKTGTTWSRMPAVIHGVTIPYQELDPMDILESGEIPDPISGNWQLSVY